MLSTIYEGHKKRREELIRKLFNEVTHNTISPKDRHKIKIILLYTTIYKTNRCRWYDDGTFEILIELETVKGRSINGYSNDYYFDRKLRTDKYILHNRHNALRFVLYHELKHVADLLKNPEKAPSEFGADSWAIKHLEGAK